MNGNNFAGGTSTRGQRVAAALRADRTETLAGGQPSLDPAALTALAESVTHRLRSTGGRPTDPAWELTRQVPFSTDTWHRLGQLAQDLSARGRRVAASQVAAMLVEKALDGLAAPEAAADALDNLDAHVEAHERARRGGPPAR